jgi:hypothetical protein
MLSMRRRSSTITRKADTSILISRIMSMCGPIFMASKKPKTVKKRDGNLPVKLYRKGGKVK